MGRNIKEWIEEERPREKMMSSGSTSLTNTELIAILLRSGTKDKTAVDIARDMLCLNGNSLENIASKSIRDLCAIPGIGMAKAASLCAAFELGRRSVSESALDSRKPVNPYGIATMMSPVLKDLRQEECWVIYLNSANYMIGKERISSGGLDSTIMDTRIILKKAVEKLSSGIILVHNHPSGNPRPSRSDIKNTAALKEAAALFDIRLVDHIIIGSKKYYSFSEGN